MPQSQSLNVNIKKEICRYHISYAYNHATQIRKGREMRLDSPRFAKVGKYNFTSMAFMSEPEVMKDGSTKRSIIGYHSDRWAVPGGAEWDDMRLRQFAQDMNQHVDYEV